MKISEISPVVYGMNLFKYSPKATYRNILSEKSQYLYRFVFVTKGSLSFFIDEKEYFCKAGDLVFLTPGQKYRLGINGDGFSLLDVYFDFTEQDGANDTRCVFINDFSKDLCHKKINFEDAEIFNDSKVFSFVSEEIFKRLSFINKSDPLYGFYYKSAISYLVSEILQKSSNAENVGRGEEILEYINLHPESDLSAEALSQKFSYHKNYINSLVKKSVGISLSSYIKTVKIRYAKTLLLEGEMNLCEVASLLGYYDYSHFYKAFTSVAGETPTEYVKNKIISL